MADAAAALDSNEAGGAFVLDRDFLAGVHGQFLGGEVVLALHAAVDDPAIGVGVVLGVDDGLEVVVFLEVRIHVRFPVELIDDEVDVLVLVGGHVLHEQRPGHVAAFHEALVHAEDVAAPLGFIGHEGAGGVEDARSDHPARAWLQTVGLGEIEDAVVALVPVFDAAAHLLAGGAGLEAHEGVGEVVADGVHLGREVIGLGLAFLAHQRGLFGVLVHVVGDGAHVVEELGIHRPLLVGVPDGVADDLAAENVHRVLQREAGTVVDHIAQAFVLIAVVVGRGGGGAEPALVDAAAVLTQRVVVLGVQLEAASRLEERAGHPGGGQAQDAFAGFQRALGGQSRLVSGNGIHGRLLR